MSHSNEPYDLARTRRKHEHNVAGISVTQRELGILYATTTSENAQTLEMLAKTSRATLAEASRTMNSLIKKKILRPIESYDNRILFGFSESDRAQAVYCEIYQVPPIE